MAAELAVRTPHRLTPDPRRVITKLFVPGEETARSPSRAGAVIARILAMDEVEVAAATDAIVADFRGRHPDLTGTFSRHFAVVAHEVGSRRRLSAERRMLIGACFTHEYAPEAAALCNPAASARVIAPRSASAPESSVRAMRCSCTNRDHAW
jgi:hypothetical protein